MQVSYVDNNLTSCSHCMYCIYLLLHVLYVLYVLSVLSVLHADLYGPAVQHFERSLAHNTEYVPSLVHLAAVLMQQARHHFITITYVF